VNWFDRLSEVFGAPAALSEPHRVCGRKHGRRRRGSVHQAGFVEAAERPQHSFGHDLVGENWELAL